MRICSARRTSTRTQQTPRASGDPSPFAYFTQTQSEGKNKFQNVQIILKASYNSLLQSPQSLDITKFISDVKTQQLICGCIKSSAVLEQNPSNGRSFCYQVHRLYLQRFSSPAPLEVKGLFELNFQMFQLIFLWCKWIKSYPC